MRLCPSILLICAALVLGQSVSALWASPRPAEKQGPAVAEALVGTWRLVSVETTRPNGEIIYPFYGRHPVRIADLRPQRMDERADYLGSEAHCSNSELP